MPYATNNQISKAEIEGGIPITDEQYAEAREHMKTGIVKVVNDTLYLASRRPHDKAGMRVEFDKDKGDWSVIEVPQPECDEETQQIKWDAETLGWVILDIPDQQNPE